MAPLDDTNSNGVRDSRSDTSSEQRVHMPLATRRPQADLGQIRPSRPWLWLRIAGPAP